MNAIEVKNISKSYGKVLALSDVSFSVGQGSRQNIDVSHPLFAVAA